MPQRPIPKYWRDRVISVLAEHNGDISVRQIILRLKDHAGELEQSEEPDLRTLVGTYPSERTIARIKTVEWPRMSEEQRSRYRDFYWPESMSRGDLPWEASAVGLYLLRLIDMECGIKGRPGVRMVWWLWRVSQAVPDAPLDLRVSLAKILALDEITDKPSSLRGLEWELAYSPWESDAQNELYGKAISRTENPIPERREVTL